MVRKTKAVLISIVVSFLVVGPLLSVPVHAVFCVDPNGDPSDAFEYPGDGCPGGFVPTAPPNNDSDDPENGATPFDLGVPDNENPTEFTEVESIGCSNTNVVGEDNTVGGQQDNPIFCQFIRIINFLSVGVTIVAAITIAIAALQYTAARGDPNRTAAAVNRIIQVAVGIAIYIFGWFLLNWLIPGGVLN